MKFKGNTVLITGGATGIGFALAQELVPAGNEVIICGRRESKLAEAKSRLPQIHTRVCDVSKEKDRRELFAWASSHFPQLNILVNNAGIQRMIDLTKGIEALAGEDEIEINLKAGVHLSALFIPFFLEKQEAAIINVSSGLGFVPLAIMPVYCATKAAVHPFSISLRYQLRNSPVKVFEIIPPMVDTELDRGGRDRRGQEYRGIPPGEVAKAAINALEKNDFEVAVGMAENLRAGSRSNPEQVFQNMNKR
jgi:uncharacterized oxidoreductase